MNVGSSLREPVIQALGEVEALQRRVGERRAENGRLKGAPAIRPGGMDKITDPVRPAPTRDR
jgi:hypothetical protein